MDTQELTTENRAEIMQGVTLTKEIALAIQNCILSGERWYDLKNRLIHLKLKKEGDEEQKIVFSARTYDSWIAREAVIPDTNKTLRELVEASRQKYKEIKEKKADAETVANSERALKELQALPIYQTRVDRVLKRDDKGKMREVRRVVSKDISAPLVHAKVKTLMFALERLNPQKYGEKGEVKHLHAIFSLADLRKHKEEQRLNQHESK